MAGGPDAGGGTGSLRRRLKKAPAGPTSEGGSRRPGERARGRDEAFELFVTGGTRLDVGLDGDLVAVGEPFFDEPPELLVGGTTARAWGHGVRPFGEGVSTPAGLGRPPPGMVGLDCTAGKPAPPRLPGSVRPAEHLNRQRQGKQTT